jgi:citrate lyase subunit beta/citryl-CoA lyase
MNRGLDTVTPLFVPADRPERYGKAASSGADAIIIDLEDAVAPEAKPAARLALCASGALPASGAVYVRVNALGTPWHADDIKAVGALAIAGIMLPKAKRPDEIASIAAVLRDIPIIALIETAAGLAAARMIAGAGSVARLAFGSIDFCADLGLQHTREALLFARSEIVLASRLGGLMAPLDGVTTSIDEPMLIEDDALHANILGFGGKLCIHPRQLSPARAGFMPSAAEISWARKILAAGDGGATLVDGTMVDAPVRLRARQILRRIEGEAKDTP